VDRVNAAAEAAEDQVGTVSRAGVRTVRSARSPKEAHPPASRGARDAAEPAREPRWLTDDQQRDWRAFYYAIVRLQEALDRDLLHEFNLPHGYYEIFVRLSEAPERSMRMSELAAATRSSRSRLSHAVARLEEAGWVERESCETDRRGQIARLTDAGMVLLTRAAPSHVESVRTYLVDPLTADQLRQLGEIGRIVYDSISD
jgi:DNA-binding MarR family transcriptional regulator